METFKIIFYRENEDKKENGQRESETVEFMALNDLDAIQTFQSAEPFAMIVKIEQI